MHSFGKGSVTGLKTPQTTHIIDLGLKLTVDSRVQAKEPQNRAGDCSDAPFTPIRRPDRPCGRNQISDSYTGRACWSTENTPSTSEVQRNASASCIAPQCSFLVDMPQNPRPDRHFTHFFALC